MSSSSSGKRPLYTGIWFYLGALAATIAGAIMLLLAVSLLRPRRHRRTNELARTAPGR
jgi:high-affinity nickel permease